MQIHSLLALNQRQLWKSLPVVHACRQFSAWWIIGFTFWL